MTDIVERLRKRGSLEVAGIHGIAADTIEALRAELATLKAEQAEWRNNNARYDPETGAVIAYTETGIYSGNTSAGWEAARALTRELDALKAQQGEPVVWPEGWDGESLAAWLKDRSQSFDPYIQGPLMRRFACFIDDTPLYTAPPNTEALKGALKVARDTLEHLGLGENTRRTAIAIIDAALGDKP